MRRGLCGLVALGLVLGMVGCGDKKLDPEAEKLCTRAADRYITCVEGMLGKEMADQARSKRKEGVEACARDQKTLDMYKACLPKEDCDAFLDCTLEYAGSHGP